MPAKDKVRENSGGGSAVSKITMQAVWSEKLKVLP